MAQDFAVVERRAQRRLVVRIAAVQAAGAAERAVFLLQPRHAHRRLDVHRAIGQLGPGGGIESAGLQSIQRENAPGTAVHTQGHPHAVVHRQRLADQGVEQAVVGVGQLAVVVEAGDLVARQEGREARMLLHGKAPAERFAHQAVNHDRQQMVFFQAQQGHGAAAKVGAQPTHQALQAEIGRQFGRQIHQPRGVFQGIHDPRIVLMTLIPTVKKTI